MFAFVSNIDCFTDTVCSHELEGLPVCQAMIGQHRVSGLVEKCFPCNSESNYLVCVICQLLFIIGFAAKFIHKRDGPALVRV